MKRRRSSSCPESIELTEAERFEAFGVRISGLTWAIDGQRYHFIDKWGPFLGYRIRRGKRKALRIWQRIQQRNEVIQRAIEENR